jgi:hypothetical protein
VLLGCRILSVAVFALVLAAGVMGSQSPFHNIAPVMVWVIGWVGLSFVSALVGDLWALINPWKILFAWAHGLFQRPAPAPLPGRPWPPGLGLWPAAGLFLAFAWMELVWAGRDRPRSLAMAILAYSAITWLGMLVFGREPWLRHGEVFSRVFALLARFAPTEVRVTDRTICRACACEMCRDGRGPCVNCHDCYARAAPAAREWNLRPPAVGLLEGRPVSPSLLALLLLILSTVTLDGFIETPLWAGLQEAATAIIAPSSPSVAHAAAAGAARVILLTVTLIAAPLVFFALYGACARLMARAAGEPAPGLLARRFVLTLLPIAIAYHVAHYLPFLLLAGQLVIPLASDPFGVGWDLLGTSLYRIDIGIVDARFIWYTAATAIVAGHVLAVYLAHATALGVFGDPRRAVRSQIPMLVLMVGYTMVSLWILAQPVIELGAR